MADTTNIRFTINLRSSTSSVTRNQIQRGDTGPIGEVNDAVNKLGTYLLTDIAFRAARGQQRNIQNQLEAKFAGIAMRELNNMGRKIASLGTGLGPSARHPAGGRLEIEGPVSQSFARANPSGVAPMSISAVTGQWRARTEEYLRRKAKKFGHRKWWLNTGELRNQLKSGQMYLAAYGPVRVTFTPTRVESSRVAGGAFRRSNLATGVGRTYTIQTGTVKMTVLGNITSDMLAAPGQRAYDSRMTGLFGRLPESVELKLLGRDSELPPRVLLEPFLTFYLNRQIPNRIWYELEKSMRSL